MLTTASSPVFAGLEFSQPQLMGVINVTPDSFSDGGDALAIEDAVAQGQRLLAEGASILDIGGESTRPGADAVGVEEEKARVLPVIKTLAAAGATLSIDTRHADVMQAAVRAGAKIINDVGALRGEGALDAAAEAAVPVVLMHMQGEPGTMQNNPTYDDVLAEVLDFLADRIRACQSVGIAQHNIAVDPGIGFGKTVDHNATLLKNLARFGALGCPVLLGVSRKSYIAKLDRDVPPKERVAGSIATALKAYDQGVRMFRVHDVAAHRQALAIHQALS